TSFSDLVRILHKKEQDGENQINQEDGFRKYLQKNQKHRNLKKLKKIHLKMILVKYFVSLILLVAFIPTLQEEQEEELIREVAQPPEYYGHKIQSLKELDKDLQFSLPKKV